ncbi:MAG TPA: hypothetical protein VJS44_00615 [Pyrinomonadaceae bacterium]|nr:hypothetical protein [Pyrinomonadaceae bacterium]
MKKLMLIIVAVLIATAVVGVFWGNKRVTAMDLQFNVEDMPAHGITIVSPSDASFDGLMAIYQQRHPTIPIQELKPLSFFIKNTTSQTVVGYKINLECTKHDGSVITKSITDTTLWALTNPEEPGLKASIAKSKTVIKPNGILFQSLALPPEALDSSTGKSTLSPLEQKPLTGEIRAAAIELKTYSRITLKLAGAFLDDGTFIGADSRYYEQIKAQVDANHNLLREISDGIQSGRSNEEVFSPVAEAANETEIKLSHQSSPADLYKYSRRLMAIELMGLKKSKGDDKALERVNKMLSKAWPNLRRANK